MPAKWGAGEDSPPSQVFPSTDCKASLVIHCGRISASHSLYFLSVFTPENNRTFFLTVLLCYVVLLLFFLSLLLLPPPITLSLGSSQGKVEHQRPFQKGQGLPRRTIPQLLACNCPHCLLSVTVFSSSDLFQVLSTLTPTSYPHPHPLLRAPTLLGQVPDVPYPPHACSLGWSGMTTCSSFQLCPSHDCHSPTVFASSLHLCDLISPPISPILSVLFAQITFLELEPPSVQLEIGVLTSQFTC